MVKNLPANAGDARDAGLISRSRRSPRGGNGNLLQYSYLKNSMDRRAWWIVVPWGHKEVDTTEHVKTILKVRDQYEASWGNPSRK